MNFDESAFEDHEKFLTVAFELIKSRKKMTSKLYQKILSGDASIKLLQNFVIHRYPIKNFWTRNISGIASRIDNYELRRELIENIYEEETGKLTNSDRHLNTFVNFGEVLGLKRSEIVDGDIFPETEAIIDHNLNVCNNNKVHFTEGVLSVLLLMEGQPPIISASGNSMEKVMKEVYKLPEKGYEYFSHHASSTKENEFVSDLEDEHANTAIKLLKQYCNTVELRRNALISLQKAMQLRHEHFDMIYNKYYQHGDAPFRMN
ncbi:TenA family transcriptional regulator [Leptospira santarosai]|uniref:TenA family transcriptional regulator n=1 Tax=Leptospira santarosai TaxID=28183 RepID=UPI0002BE2BEF|nr:iron-containing redox enzyme family protein [Leptospira santarosai]EMO73405.1 TENA/THI-4 family protein [Leptospira santarosai str. 200403458]EMO98252.1 TENA/THI-4 family protein [Leptospira santarosai str. 200702252]